MARLAARPGIRRPALALVSLAAAAVAGAPAPASAASPCASISDRRLEVCTAYVVNATYLARVPFYIASGVDNPALVRLARYRLESRYQGAAQAAIEAQVAAWLSGDVDVERPRIAIDSVTVGPRAKRAVLHTRETWLVRKRDEATGAMTTVFQETDAPHDVVMARVRGLILHKWVVVSDSGLP